MKTERAMRKPLTIAGALLAVALTACGSAANEKKDVVIDPATQVKELVVTDLTVSYKVGWWGADSSAYINIRNLFDAIPPIVAGGNATPNGGNNVADGDDIVGRFFAVGVRTKF